MAFIPDLGTLLSFSLASLLLAITPGPDMTLFVSRALSQGRAAGLACVFGALSGIAVHTMLVAFGLSALVVASPAAFLVLKVGGAAYLLWLAVQALRKGSTLSVEREADGSRRSLAANWLQALGINLLNPKIIIFFMTFLPQFVSAGDPHVRGKLLVLGALFVVVSLPVVITIVLVADRLAAWLKSHPKAMRGVDYAFGAVFSAFALKILMTQAR